MDWMTTIIDAIARETVVFAAVGLFLGGLDDLAVDLVFLFGRLWRASPVRRVADLSPLRDAPLAIFVPAWDESRVIGQMLGTALARYGTAEFRLFVGTYPNDRATIDAVAAIAERDPRIRLVIGDRPGPTTKADCLNGLWRALARDDFAAGLRTAAVILHDAEDIVDAHELAVFRSLIGDHDVVQIPVLPLVQPGSPLVSGHYVDEFIESHAKQILVRVALGAGMPLAGTGCAVAMPMLKRIAAERGGEPFDASSLTEDYELGLHIAQLGGRSVFARVRGADGRLVAVRAYFPGNMRAAVKQKARWMTGIALAGWDRTGWARPRAVGDHWMRMRDRRGPLAVLVLATSYVGVIAWGLSTLAHWGDAGGTTRLPAALVLFNMTLLVWRMAMRAIFTGREYGLGEALWSLPRFFTGNLVALLAAPRALFRYAGILRGDGPTWDKTQHDFPDAGGVPAL